MKETGIVRQIDELGRVVIPKEIRRTMNINERDSLEIFVDRDFICLRKYDYNHDYLDIVNRLKTSIQESPDQKAKGELMVKLDEIAAILKRVE